MLVDFVYLSFFSGGSVIMGYGVSHLSRKQCFKHLVLIMDLNLTQIQLFTSYDINWWNWSVDNCDVLSTV